jgi:hypothetical protein
MKTTRIIALCIITLIFASLSLQGALAIISGNPGNLNGLNIYTITNYRSITGTNLNISGIDTITPTISGSNSELIIQTPSTAQVNRIDLISNQNLDDGTGAVNRTSLAFWAGANNVAANRGLLISVHNQNGTNQNRNQVSFYTPMRNGSNALMFSTKAIEWLWGPDTNNIMDMAQMNRLFLGSGLNYTSGLGYYSNDTSYFASGINTYDSQFRVTVGYGSSNVTPNNFIVMSGNSDTYATGGIFQVSGTGNAVFPKGNLTIGDTTSTNGSVVISNGPTGGISGIGTGGITSLVGNGNSGYMIIKTGSGSTNGIEISTRSSDGTTLLSRMKFNGGAAVPTINVANANLLIQATADLQIAANTSAETCSAGNAGMIYYDGATFKHYGCNSTAWNALY